MIFLALSLRLFAGDVEMVDFVPKEIKCAVPLIIESIDNGGDVNGLLDAWEGLPSQCSIGDCCIDTSDSQTRGDGYVWKCNGSAWEMRPSVYIDHDTTCRAGYEIWFETPLYYSTSVFMRDFSFIPSGNQRSWMRGKEYASHSFSIPSENIRASGWLSGRVGRLKFMNKKPLPCIKREYKFHSGDSLVFCAKPKSDSGTPSK